MSLAAKIMVVDDSAMSRRMLRRILETGGHSVVEEGDGLSALERYALEKPDLVFLDLVMSGMYGLDVLIELRKLHPEARIVIASADIQQATRVEALAAGACGFVSKPFVASDVLKEVEAAVNPLQGAPR